MTFKAFLCVIVFSASLRGGESELALFEANYPEAARRLEAGYSQARCTYQLRQTQGPVAIRIEAGEFATDHGFEKLTFHREMTVGAKQVINTTTVYCVSQATAFKLTRSEKEAFRVEGIGETDSERSEFRAIFGRYAKAPFAMSGIPMTAISRNPDFRVLSVDRTTLDGRPLLKVACEIDGRFKQVFSLYIDQEAS